MNNNITNKIKEASSIIHCNCTNSLKTNMALLSFLINHKHQTRYTRLSVYKWLYLQQCIAIYLLSRNKCLIKSLARKKSLLSIKPKLVCFQSLHPFQRTSLTQKVTTNFCLSHYTELHSTSVKPRFSWASKRYQEEQSCLVASKTLLFLSVLEAEWQDYLHIFILNIWKRG